MDVSTVALSILGVAFGAYFVIALVSVIFYD